MIELKPFERLSDFTDELPKEPVKCNASSYHSDENFSTFNKIHTKYGIARLHKDGYYQISSGKEGNHGKLLHRLIYSEYYGIDLSPVQIVHHKNENKWDNRIENLELMGWKNHSRHHQPTNNLRRYTKLSEDDLLQIFYELKHYYHGLNSVLARKYGVTPNMISKIKNGDNLKEEKLACLKKLSQEPFYLTEFRKKEYLENKSKFDLKESIWRKNSFKERNQKVIENYQSNVGVIE